jgi:hypothetical protein
MTLSDAKIELLDRILARNLAWIAAADSRLAPLMAVDTAMLGVLAALVPSAPAWRVVPAIVTASSAVLVIVSILSLVAGTFPRLTGPRASLLYFGGIASLEPDQYVARVLSATSDDLLRDFATQCHRNAEIAKAKFQCVKLSMILMFAAVPVWLAAIALLYAARQP